MLEVIGGKRVTHIACVQRTGRFKEHHVDFLTSDRTMLRPARDDREFAFAKLDGSLSTGRVLVIHAKSPVNYEEQLVLRVMVMPHEFALKLDQLDVLSVELAHDFGRPMILESGELLRHVDLVHDSKVAQKLSPVTGASIRGSNDGRSNVARPNKGQHASRSADLRRPPLAQALGRR